MSRLAQAICGLRIHVIRTLLTASARHWLKILQLALRSNGEHLGIFGRSQDRVHGRQRYVVNQTRARAGVSANGLLPRSSTRLAAAALNFPAMRRASLMSAARILTGASSWVVHTYDDIFISSNYCNNKFRDFRPKCFEKWQSEEYWKYVLNGIVGQFFNTSFTILLYGRNIAAKSAESP